MDSFDPFAGSESPAKAAVEAEAAQQQQQQEEEETEEAAPQPEESKAEVVVTAAPVQAAAPPAAPVAAAAPKAAAASAAAAAAPAAAPKGVVTSFASPPKARATRPARRSSTGGYMNATSASSARKDQTESARKQRRASRSASPGPSKRMQSLTKPASPNFGGGRKARGRKAARTSYSSEELELQAMETARMESEAQRKKRAQYHRHSASASRGSNGSSVAAAATTLTKPAELSERLRATESSKSRKRSAPSPLKAANFGMQLRSAKSALAVPRMGNLVLTKPESPKFAKRGTASSNAPKAKVTSTAELLAKFSSTTAVPHRFHSKPANNNVGTPQKASKPLTLTRPVAPVLHGAKKPKHTSSMLSTEQREIAELDKFEQFKARPVNKAVMDSAGDLGVPKVPKRALTKPQEFKFHANKKRAAADTTTTSAADAQMPVFKARKFDPKGPIFKVQAQATALTQPQSPNFATKRRAAARPAPEAAPEATAPVFKARPMPSPSAAAPLRSVEPRSLTEPAPFNMPGDRLRAEKVARTQMAADLVVEEERKAKQFKARPAKVLEATPFVAAASAKPLCEFQEFALASVGLHDMDVARREEELKQEQERMRGEAAFHAKPVPSTHSHPMAVQPSEKELTIVEDVVMHSSQQAAARAAFEAENTERMAALEQKKRTDLEAKLVAENAEVKELRKAMSFKAKPITVPRSPLRALQQQNELTIPESPAFATKARAAARPAAGENAAPTLMSQ